MNFGENLKKARLNKKMKQASVADIIGVAVSTYTNYENGRRTPDINILIKISDALDISLDVLLNTKFANTMNDININYFKYTDLINKIESLDEDDAYLIDGYTDKIINTNKEIELIKKRKMAK